MTTDAAEEAVHPPPDAPTFEEVYRTHYSRLVMLARLTSADGAPAEEIVQDAFVQVLRRWDSVEYPLTYLRIAVVNGCRSSGRRRRLERRTAEPRHEPVVFDPVAIAVRDAIRTLTPRQRAAVVMRFYEDLPEREIAAVLGCRPGTVKSLLSRSIARLKELLDD